MTDKTERETAEIWVHGYPAHSWEQVVSYLNGDAHDRSKVQVFVGGRFYDVAEPSS